MPLKKYKPEQIVTLLRQIEVEIANGNTPQACRDAQITTWTFYRWMGTREPDRRVPVAARKQVLQMYASRSFRVVDLVRAPSDNDSQ
jgi:hypothetical protein